MSKILDATCNSTGVVKVGDTEVPGANILSQGKQASSGVVILDGALKAYVASSATDVKTTIEKSIDVLTSLTAALTQIATTLTAIGAGMTGPTTTPPVTLATDVTTINTKVSELNTIKSALTTLKDALK